MSKRTIYTLFIAKFVFSLSLIFWTIWMTLGAGVGQDTDLTFNSYYHDVDENFNQIITNNNKFSNKYAIEFKMNDFLIDSLTYEDIYLSQRVINDRKERKNILAVGENNFTLQIKDKNTNQPIKDFTAKITLTMPSTHAHNQDLTFGGNIQQKTIQIQNKSYWNVMGEINVGDDIGRFYLKTNAI